MSGFVCGMRKFDKHKMFASERPNNTALYDANQKSFNDLMKQREQQDKGVFLPITTFEPVFQPSITNTSYTPWKVPSATQ